MEFTFAQNTPIVLERPTRPVQNAADILRRDLARLVTGRLKAPGAIRVLLPEREDPFDESYTIDIAVHGVQVRAASSLGAVYALLFISERFLGVQPFWFWLNCLPAPREYVRAAVGQYESRPAALRFRGWFFNDEVLIASWRPPGEDRDFVWRMGLEALLRSGGNMAVPGTDHNSHRNRELAAGMGLWITHHHAEPLGAPLFAHVYPNESPSFAQNEALFLDVWRKGIRAQKHCNVIWALGFRGQGDKPFWEDDPGFATPEERGGLISRAIKAQYALLREEVPNPVCCINLYGEILELYCDGHLTLPEGVICVWADSGYGKMVSRRQGNHNPRVPALPTQPGAHGVYYHASFYDLQASNHITMLPNPPALVCGELGQAFAVGADDFLIVNCGNIRMHCYILDLVATLWHNGSSKGMEGAHLAAFTAAYFGGEASVARALQQYADHTIQYGSEPDEKAGEQFYHHPVRELAAAWMRGEPGPIKSLVWLGGDRPFAGQVARYAELVQPAVASWKAYEAECARTASALPAPLAQRFFDLVGVQAILHASGAEGAALFCQGCLAADAGDLPRAFALVHAAKQQYMRGLEGFAAAEHGRWQGFYDNDCLTDVRLTIEFLGVLQAFLRVQGEGADSHSWHRRYLMEESERGVALITNFDRPLSNDALAKALGEAAPPHRAQHGR